MTTKEKTETETAATETPATGEAKGMRSRRALMLKQFLPNADWINTQVVAKGKGTKVVVGRIYGVATGFEDKINTLPDGSTAASIAIKGVFQSESYLTGEVGEATNVYFPMAYAEKIKALFETDETVRVVEVDTDIGLEATGKTIPYEWVVVAFVEGEEMAALKRLRNSRGRPANAPALPAPNENKSLTDQLA